MKQRVLLEVEVETEGGATHLLRQGDWFDPLDFVTPEGHAQGGLMHGVEGVTRRVVDYKIVRSEPVEDVAVLVTLTPDERRAIDYQTSWGIEVAAKKLREAVRARREVG